MRNPTSVAGSSGIGAGGDGGGEEPVERPEVRRTPRSHPVRRHRARRPGQVINDVGASTVLAVNVYDPVADLVGFGDRALRTIQVSPAPDPVRASGRRPSM